MAKTSSILKNDRRREKAQKYFAHRKELRAKAANPNLSEEEKWSAQVKLQKLDRNTSIIRVRNRCNMTGRPRGFLRKFGMSRIATREMALAGRLPGVTKASW